MSSGKASITYLGHSAALLVTETGKRVLFDPWLEGNPTCPEHLRDPGQVDYICLTHGHDDHAGTASILAKTTGATVFAIWELCTLLNKDGVPEDRLQRMNKGGTVRVQDIGVTLTHAFHSSSYTTTDSTGKLAPHYAGEACGVVFHLESGRKVYHAGDTALFSDMKLIGDTYSPVLALLPIGDRLTMGPTEAAVAASLIRAPKVIPIHHSTFPGLSGTPEEFEKALLSKSPSTKCHSLKPGETQEF